jgi:hypothetical protein
VKNLSPSQDCFHAVRFARYQTLSRQAPNDVAQAYRSICPRNPASHANLMATAILASTKYSHPSIRRFGEGFGLVAAFGRRRHGAVSSQWRRFCRHESPRSRAGVS